MQEPTTVPIAAEEIRASLRELLSHRVGEVLQELLEHELDEIIGALSTPPYFVPRSAN